MEIGRSPCSGGPSCPGNRAWEAGRSPPKGAKRITASDRERVSPSESEPDSASLRYLYVASLPKVVKPGTDSEATVKSTCRAYRGGWGERARKAASRNLGDPDVGGGTRPGSRINKASEATAGSRRGP
jgi:hypothetical protein